MKKQKYNPKSPEAVERGRLSALKRWGERPRNSKCVRLFLLPEAVAIVAGIPHADRGPWVSRAIVAAAAATKGTA